MSGNQTLVEKFYTQLSAGEGGQTAKVSEEAAVQSAPPSPAPEKPKADLDRSVRPTPSHILPVNGDTVGLAGGLVSIIRKRRRKQS